MARRSISQIPRGRGIRHEKECIIFNFEGKDNKTEELYFMNFQNRNNPYVIKPITCSSVTDPLLMVKVLIAYIKREGINLADNYKAYCVFDTDVDSNKQERIDRAIELAKDNNIEIILSTPCFEVWYREHYGYTRRYYSSSDDVITDLRRKIPKYKKNIDIYDDIKEMTDNAIENCKRLEKEQCENGKSIRSVQCSPYTGVYRVVEYLIKKREEM